MSNEAEKDPKQEKQQQDPIGSAKPADAKTNPTPGNQSGNRPQDISKKNPSQDNDPQQGQEKPEDEKRRAS